MNSPAVDLAGFLVTDGVGVIGTTIFVPDQPPTPDVCITLKDTGGFESEANFSYERPTVQAIVRGARGNYATVYALAKSVKDALHGKHGGDAVGGATYVGIWCMGDIHDMGEDDDNRKELSINFRIHRQ